MRMFHGVLFPGELASNKNMVGLLRNWNLWYNNVLYANLRNYIELVITIMEGNQVARNVL